MDVALLISASRHRRLLRIGDARSVASDIRHELSAAPLEASWACLYVSSDLFSRGKVREEQRAFVRGGGKQEIETERQDQTKTIEA